MTADELLATVEDRGLRLVRFLYCDNGGTIRGKASSRHGLEGRIESGIGLTVAMQAMNSLDQLQPVPDMGPVGEVRLRPDPGTFRVLPFAPNTGAMFVDMIGPRRQPGARVPALVPEAHERAPGGARRRIGSRSRTSSRSRRAVDGGYEPVDSSLCFSTIGMTQSQDVIDDLVAALDAQGIVLEQYYAELGHGQHEISTGHAPALQAVDEQIFVRETIRAVASAHGLVASLAPKPWPQNAGNGCHIHFSLWEGDRTASTTPPAPAACRPRRSRSSPGSSSICPACAAWPPRASTPITASSRTTGRARSRAGASTTARRRCGCRRVYAGREAASTNAELKAADASCNPYLAVGGLIAAGLDGIERGLEPPDPVQVDPGTLPADERAAKGIRPLPSSQREALDALAADAVLTGAMGDVLARSYLAVRGSEWDVYSAADEAFEQQGHFQKY